MDYTFSMANTDRHIDLVQGISHSLYYNYRDLVHSRELKLLQESAALVFEGSLNCYPTLIDIDNCSKEISDLNILNYVQPDIFCFYTNSYLLNSSKNRYAGCPDLIIEVWSESNTHLERIHKFNLYSSSSMTEHWYIDLTSPEVECYKGIHKLNNQSLNQCLVTQNGLNISRERLRFSANVYGTGIAGPVTGKRLSV